MSKTSQRKNQAFKEGYNDALKGKPYRWTKHPFLGVYNAGWLKGRFDRRAKRIKDYPELTKQLVKARNPDTGAPAFDPAEIVRIISQIPEGTEDRADLKCMFVWSETPEGREYWSNICDRTRYKGVHDE